MTKLEITLFFRTWVSTAMLLKPVTKKHKEKEALGQYVSSDWKKTRLVQQKYEYVCVSHSSETILSNEIHQDPFFYIFCSKLGRISNGGKHKLVVSESKESPQHLTKNADFTMCAKNNKTVAKWLKAGTGFHIPGHNYLIHDPGPIKVQALPLTVGIYPKEFSDHGTGLV